MGDRRKNKEKARGSGANTRDYNTPYPTTQSSTSRSDRGIKDPIEFLEYKRINEELEDAALNRDSKSEKFVTLNSLEKIWQKDTGQGTLGRFLDILRLDIFLFDDITRNLIKTISILSAIRWNGWETFESIFLDESRGSVRQDRSDANLPYTLEDLRGQQYDEFLGNHWAGKFLTEQYTFIPIILEEGRNETYPRGRPLPFIRSKTVKLKKGGYGSVTKEVIACHHFLSIPSTGKPFLHHDETSVARKRFPAKGDFRQEARTLTDLNSSLSYNRRIVQYLAVFTVEDEEDQEAPKEFNIILPLADADLQQFLYGATFDGAWNNVAKILEEASNLAGALSWLHGGLIISGKALVCCHMDLKLDNVLVYLERNSPIGWWKISDFGISSLKERKKRKKDHKKEPTDLRRPTSALLAIPTMSPAESLNFITTQERTSVKRPAGAFSAPEVEAGGNVGPESDIFSFGCVLFQVLARVAGGVPLLMELDGKRGSFQNGSRNDHFCQRTDGKKLIHKDVSLWLKSSDGLRGTLSDRSMIMNCKGLIEKTLEIAPEARPDAEELHGELVMICRGEGKKYYFDQDSNMVSNVPQSSASKSKLVERPEIRITPSSSKTEQRDPPHRMSVSTMSMPISPLISPQPNRSSLGIMPPQTFQPTSQPLPTPPLDPDHHDSPVFKHPGPMSSIDRLPFRKRSDQSSTPNVYNIHVPQAANFPQRSDNPSSANLYNNQTRYGTDFREGLEHPPPANLYNEQTQNATGLPGRSGYPPPQIPFLNRAQDTVNVEFVSSPTPLHYSPVSFPQQRLRQDSAHTTHSSIYDVVANYSERGELIPFSTPQEVTSTLISSTRAKIVFIAAKEAVAYTLYSPYSKKTIPLPNNCEWQKGSLAGNFVALCSVSGSYNTQRLHLYKLSLNDQKELVAHEMQFKKPLPYFEKFAVSLDGKILLGGSDIVRLYASYDTDGKDLPISALQGNKLQRLWFSTNGRFAFAWFSLPGNLHCVKIWDVVDINKNGILKLQIPASENSASAVKDIIHFPSSPMCLVWKEHHFISLLQNSGSPHVAPVAHSLQLKNLQAMVVTPNEEAVVFITGSRSWRHAKSKISIGRINQIGETKVLASISKEEDLQYYLNKPEKCNVVIEDHNTSTNTKVRVLIAHSNGIFEVKELNLLRVDGV